KSLRLFLTTSRQTERIETRLRAVPPPTECPSRSGIHFIILLILLSYGMSLARVGFSVAACQKRELQRHSG
ncbi:uncharacterized, partial [Tachysurus ichikawai]